MVWSTTQSALYNDLSRYYEAEKRVPNPQETEPQKFEQKILEKSLENHGEKEHSEPRRITCDPPCSSDRRIPEKNDRDPHPNCPSYPNCPIGQSCSRNSLTQLFSDRDMLLIAGLIFLLIKQGADKKLILALAFVLLS